MLVGVIGPSGRCLHSDLVFTFVGGYGSKSTHIFGFCHAIVVIFMLLLPHCMTLATKGPL